MGVTHIPPDGEAQPQQTRRRRRAVQSPEPPSSPPVQGPTYLADASTLLPDIRALQDERYDQLEVGPVREYAVEHDRAHPLWSVCHKWTPTMRGSSEMRWKRDWVGIQQLYVVSDIRLLDIADLSGIPLRTLEAASSRLGWREARRTQRLLTETALRQARLSDMETTAQEHAIRSMLTDAGQELMRHALVALARSTDSIQPRDIPMMAQTALKLLGAGAKLPTDYRHSVVDNPSATPQTPTVNVLNITTQADADRVLMDLAVRARRLEAIASASESAVTVSDRTEPL